MKTYEFTYILIGKGETEEEALADALDAFGQDLGLPTTSECIEEDDDA